MHGYLSCVRLKKYLYPNLGQYLSGQAKCLSVGSISCLVLFHRSVYEPHLQRYLPSHTLT